MVQGAKPTIYAIDYGTTNSLLGAANADQVWPAVPIEVAADGETSEIVRSVQLFNGETWTFGAAAMTGYSFAHDPSHRFIRSIKKFLPSPLFTATTIGPRTYLLEELIGLFLRELRERANAHFATDVRSVVLGRPAVYDLDPDRDLLAVERMTRAARFAGFETVEFFPEPTAAAYDFQREITEPQTVLIADFGGGTSDFTILRLSQDGFRDEDVLAIGGVSVAGDMLDGCIMRGKVAPQLGSNVTYRKPLGRNEISLPKSLVNKFCSPAELSFLTRREIHDVLRQVQRNALDPIDARRLSLLFELLDQNLAFALFHEIERVKKALSTEPNVQLHFNLDATAIEASVSEAEFTELGTPHVAKMMECLDEVMTRAGVQPAAIDIVCCTGGTAKVRAVRDELARRFGAERLAQHKNFHSVVAGLAQRARVLQRQ